MSFIDFFIDRLYRRVCSDEVLDLAWRSVRSNKGKPGPDGETVDLFGAHLLERLKNLQGRLRKGRYQHGPVKFVPLSKPEGGKRTLALLCVQDRVAERAVFEVLSPVIDPLLHPDSYAFRPGRSAATALDRLVELAGRDRHWVSHIDIADCFGSLEHKILKKQLRRFVSGRRVLRLIEGAVRACCPAGSNGTGIVQGSPLSPLLANVYLDAFDRDAGAARLGFVRYCDNVVLVARSKKEAEADLRLAEKLLGRFALSLNSRKTVVTHFDRGVALLGYYVCHDRRRRGRISYRPLRPQSFQLVRPPRDDRHEQAMAHTGPRRKTIIA